MAEVAAGGPTRAAPGLGVRNGLGLAAGGQGLTRRWAENRHREGAEAARSRSKAREPHKVNFTYSDF